MESCLFSGRSAPNSFQQVLPPVCLPSRRLLPARGTDPRRECSAPTPSAGTIPTWFYLPVCCSQRRLLSWCAGEGWIAAFISCHCQIVEFSRSLVSRVCSCREQLCVLCGLTGEMSPFLVPSLCCLCAWLRQCSNIRMGEQSTVIWTY